MLYIILCMLCVSRSNHHCSWKFHKFHRKTPVLESLFFLKLMKLYNIIWHLFCMNEPYFCRNFFFIDWCHKRLKNKIDLLLFYREHFYGFLGSDLWKSQKKKHSFHNKHIYIYIQSRTFWSFMKFYFVHIVKVYFVFKEQLLCLYSSIYE